MGMHIAQLQIDIVLSVKRVGTKGGHDNYMQCTFCCWQKYMSQDEVTSSSEEIKHAALSIVELNLGEGISQLVSKLVG